MTSLAAVITSALISSLWQDTLIAGGVVLVLWAVRHSARTRYATCCLALAAMLIVPLFTALASSSPTGAGASSAPLSAAATTSVSRPPARVEAQRPSLSMAGRLRSWALPLWCVGVMACSIRLLGSGAHTMRVRRRSEPADLAIRRIAAALAARMGVERPLAVVISPGGNGPATFGWLHPVIVLPAAMLGLPPDQFEAILAHEMAHIRRHDFLVNLFQLAVETLCFYHPAVWWVSHRVRLERELCCDDDVVAACGDALGYARALTFVARSTIAVPATTLGANASPLLHRVRRLLGADAPPDAPAAWMLAATAAAFVAVAFWSQAGTHAQEQAAAGGTMMTGVVIDPLGAPAEQVMLTLVGGPEVAAYTRTDARGRFRFAGVGPGTYYLRTPATDFLTPDRVEVTASGVPSLTVTLGMDETAVNVRVCRDCRDSWFKLPALVTGVPGDGMSAKVIGVAQPEEGWDAFNQRRLSYPAELRRSTLAGTVTLEGVITTAGATADLQVVSSPDPRLAAAAAALLQSQRWRPAHVHTTPVQVPLHATVEFTLAGE